MTQALASPPARVRSIVFLGTPPEAAVALDALVEAGFEVPLVVTRQDKRRGRGSTLIPSPVKAVAIERGLDVTSDLAAVSEVDVDLGVVVAYGRIIPVSLLADLAMVNVHFSLLPRWRGAAPVERAILAGDTTTGVCLMEVAEGLDEGGVYGLREVAIGENESAAELRSRLATIGAELLVDSLQAGLGPAEPQVGEVTYAAKIDRAENRLDFTRPAVELHRTIRIGRAWAEFRGARLGIEAATVGDGHGEPGRIDGASVATPDGILNLVAVKPEGKRAMSAADWLNGAKPKPGERLG